MKCLYAEETLAEMHEKLNAIGPKAESLVLRFLVHKFTDPKAREYAHHGFARRVQTLARCIHNVFDVVPPDALTVPPKEKLYDAQINIQAAIGNCYGCIDNLAWVWVHERGLAQTIDRRRVGLRKQNTDVRSTLSAELCAYLDSLDAWFDYLVDYRDAFAHRIPLYIPPGSLPPEDAEKQKELQSHQEAAILKFRFLEYERLKAEESKLYFFQPLMGHSFGEMKGIVPFHMQMIRDFLTIEELGEKVLAELAGSGTSGSSP